MVMIISSYIFPVLFSKESAWLKQSNNHFILYHQDGTSLEHIAFETKLLSEWLLGFCYWPSRFPLASGEKEPLLDFVCYCPCKALQISSVLWQTKHVCIQNVPLSFPFVKNVTALVPSIPVYEEATKATSSQVWRL